ncbi:hypothetical protein SLA2020_427920 [Shorea laevis]
MGYVGYFYIETKSFEIQSVWGMVVFNYPSGAEGLFGSVVISFQTVVWMLKMVEELWSGDLETEFCRSRRTEILRLSYKSGK